MPVLKNYVRPESLEEALQIIHREGEQAALVAGGTSLFPELAGDIDTVVDLQDVGLDHLTFDSGVITCGAMVRLQDLADYIDTPELIRDMIFHEGPNTFRHASTIGGVVASGDWESELLAALLIFEASVTVQNQSGTKTIPLNEFLSGSSEHLSGSILTEIQFQTGGETASARVARTPADKPIVAAVGRSMGGEQHRIALCGVAVAPTLLGAAGVDQLAPPSDFRGSSEYRKEMAITLVSRIAAQLEGK